MSLEHGEDLATLPCDSVDDSIRTKQELAQVVPGEFWDAAACERRLSGSAGNVDELLHPSFRSVGIIASDEICDRLQVGLRAFRPDDGQRARARRPAPRWALPTHLLTRSAFERRERAKRCFMRLTTEACA